MKAITEQQADALDRYYDLRKKYPALFESRDRRPIIHDRNLLEAYAAREGAVLGVAATTPQVYFLVDLVESSSAEGDSNQHPYSRIVFRDQLMGGINVVILATVQDAQLGSIGDIVLLASERHATGSVEIELPRGFGTPGLTGEQNALKELREETGYVGEQAHLLGSTYVDSGLGDGKVTFFHVPVLSREEPTREAEEAINDVLVFAPQEIWGAIGQGKIRDSFTLQAMALYEKGDQHMGSGTVSSP